MRFSFFALLACVISLGGCAQDRYYAPTETSAGSSGITVFGEIDSNITRSR